MSIVVLVDAGRKPTCEFLPPQEIPSDISPDDHRKLAPLAMMELRPSPKALLFEEMIDRYGPRPYFLFRLGTTHISLRSYTTALGFLHKVRTWRLLFSIFLDKRLLFSPLDTRCFD